MTFRAIHVGHASGLHEVARELARLHDSQLRGDESDADRAVRLSVLTLVAVCTNPALAELAAETVSYLAASHPARALIIVADGDGPDSIEADLSLHDSGGKHRAEQVHLTVRGVPAQHLASVVTPLLVPDVPVYLWMVGAPPMEQAFGQDAMALCERLIIDSGAYDDPAEALTTLAHETRRGAPIALEDLAWARSRTWRELIAQSFDGADVRPFVRHIKRLSILVSGDRPSAQAWLTVGWMQAKLGWDTVAGPGVRVLTSAAGDVPSGDLIAVRLDCSLDGRDATVRIERHDDTLYSGLDVGGTISASRTMPVVTPDVVHLVGGLMEEAGEDPAYRPAVEAAAAAARAYSA